MFANARCLAVIGCLLAVAGSGCHHFVQHGGCSLGTSRYDLLPASPGCGHSCGKSGGCETGPLRYALSGIGECFCCDNGCGKIYFYEWLYDPPDCCDPCDDYYGHWVGPRADCHKVLFDPLLWALALKHRHCRWPGHFGGKCCGAAGDGYWLDAGPPIFDEGYPTMQPEGTPAEPTPAPENGRPPSIDEVPEPPPLDETSRRRHRVAERSDGEKVIQIEYVITD